MDGVERIRQERERQISLWGTTQEHDVQHDEDELALAAAVYALPPEIREGSIELVNPDSPDSHAISTLLDELWPGVETQDHAVDWLFSPGDRIRELTKAGALIAAEIDRLAALAATAPPRAGAG